MHDGADLLDTLFEYAVGGGIGGHQAGEIVLMRIGLLAQVGEIDIALGVAGDHHDLEAGHHRAGGIGAMGGLGD